MHSTVISAGTVEKRDQVSEPALVHELIDPEGRREAERRLAAFACPAMAMYASPQHRQMMDGLWAVWERWGPETLGLSILSPGYGLIAATETIVPYEAAFDSDPAALELWAARQAVREKTTALVRNANLVFYLLGGPALDALALPLDVPAAVQQLVLTDAESAERVAGAPNLHVFVVAKARAARRWHVKAPLVGGFLFGRMCEQIVRHGPAVLEWLHNRPQDLDCLLYKRARWRPQLGLWSEP
ncbi:MAG TPA: hypothetical protein PKO09_13025 [Anaerolineae bacterium]|nr:hypothetical protein [Anaerolineae bacterium]